MTAQLSREQLLADIAHAEEKAATLCGACAEDHARLAGYMRMLQAGMDSEPVVTDAMALAFHQAITDSSAGSDDIDEIKTGLRAALANYAAPPAPVAVPDVWPEKLTWSHHDDMTQAEVLAWNNAIDACRAAMQAEPVTAATVPAGWKLVPIKPTMEMLDEFDSIFDFGADDSEDAWRRLLSAAPAAPEQEV